MPSDQSLHSQHPILLHCCCGPCATASIERLLTEGVTPTLFFDNPNIAPETERDLRRENWEKVATHYGLKRIVGHTPHDEWLKAVAGLEDESEGGKRCTACFAYNLILAQKAAKELRIDTFTTTLTVSRFKNSAKIFSCGEGLTGFGKWDFKKKGGFERSIVLSKELGLYRQSYCGCEFSLKRDH